MKNIQTRIMSALCITLTLSAAAAPAYADEVKYLAAQKLQKSGKYHALGVSLDSSEGPGRYRYKFLDCQIPSPLQRAKDGSPVGVECKPIGKKDGYTQAQISARNEEIYKAAGHDENKAIAAGVGTLAAGFLITLYVATRDYGADELGPAVPLLSFAGAALSGYGAREVYQSVSDYELGDRGSLLYAAKMSVNKANEADSLDAVQVLPIDSIYPLEKDLFNFLAPIK